MKFCSHDGGLLVPDKSGKKKLVCTSCGKSFPMAKEKVVLKENVKLKDIYRCSLLGCQKGIILR